MLVNEVSLSSDTTANWFIALLAFVAVRPKNRPTTKEVLKRLREIQVQLGNAKDRGKPLLKSDRESFWESFNCTFFM